MTAIISEEKKEDNKREIDGGWSSGYLDMQRAILAAEDVDKQRSIYDSWAPDYDGESVTRYYYKSVCDKAQEWVPEEALQARVLDAGCGTGALGEYLCRNLEKPPQQLVGLDLSPGMLKVAEGKKCYDTLVAANLKQELIAFFEKASFDLILSSACFIPCHLGTETIPNLLEVLKPGGYFIATVRKVMYSELKDDFAREIEAAGATLCEAEEMPYLDSLTCHVLVAKKK